MAGLLHQLLSVTVVLGAVQLISGYSFKNCIADPRSNGSLFNCISRKEEKMSAILHDLPTSAINLTISKTHVRHICNCSFVRLPKLKYLRIDNNPVNTIDQSAFQNLHQLQSLNLSVNNISELNPYLFKDLHNLTSLSLSDNKLKTLPEGIFSATLNLNTLNMRQNLLTNFSEIAESVSHLMNLKILDLCYNSLTSLSHSNVSLPKSLTTLYICRNNLSTLGCKDSFLRFINILDLSYNSRLPTTAFQRVDLRHINYLRLRSTNVRVVEFLNISNVKVGQVDFSGLGLKNDSLLMELCKLLRRKVNRIKNLHLSDNGIGHLTNYTLYYCPNITGDLDLSRNKLKSTSCLSFLRRQTYIKSFNAEHNHLTSLQSCNKQTKVSLKSLEELSYRYNRILSVNSFAFFHTPNIKKLQLNINTIAFLDRKALKGLKKLEELRLDNNLLTDLFNETFEDNNKLQVLNLRNNRISVIFNGTFLMLWNLTTLDLGGNKITHFQPSGFDGLKSLSKLYLDGNNLKHIDTSIYRVFQDTLTVLDLQSNQIRFLTENNSSPFKNLSKLSDLKLDGQRPYGMTVLPHTFFRGLYSLKYLYLTNNNIFHLPPDVFDDLTSLQFLTLDKCCVGVTQLEPGVFKNLRNLTKLTVESMGIQNFSKEVFGNLTQLSSLQLNRNVMQSIQVDALQSLPKLLYLDIRNIPLSCTCKNSLLQNWTIYNKNVQVVYLYNLQCQNDANYKFHNFKTNVCYIDLGEYLFFSTAVVIFLFTVTPLLYVKLYWKMKYSYYVFRSWFSDQWRRLREEEENCKYDAFISYNSSDEQWVMDQLLPNLEGNGSSFKLCLHHRDFELGRDIVDNIVSAVYSSRKTICVVSRNFLQSEWCSLEIQLASYRLFDEHRDVLLLVFLEPISERQLSAYHRMRKVMLKKTYLQWPDSDCTNPMQAQDLFWNQLRRAMRMGSRLKMEENINNEGCVNAESEETEHSETSDENYYLLP
ncbi:platelet-activating factor acetylhydrolase IB subunit gamma isoform X1 [Seriola dumerili]|uniref:platelet-activating factor acetylhydrolase IB subunit gamma isoform X1 n=1 Tax=Seriola dumerili TaxID=41447 RepID=UPI000BBF19DE|nr:platelet-activating factor acetylhydrolase IB subunit gamma isoform X1 [Seriola dumerili]